MPPLTRLVMCAEGPVEPTVALDSYLASNPPTPESPVEVLFGVRRTVPTLPTPLPSDLRLSTVMPGRGLRDLPVTVRTLSYSEICSAIIAGLTPDVVVAACTPALPDGHRSLGGINGYLQLAVDRAKSVVLEECRTLPHVPGAAIATHWDVLVAGPDNPSSLDAPLAAAPGDLDRMIATNVAGLIPDRAVLALGVGKVAEAVAGQLADRHGLRVVTGAVGAEMRRLAESGALDPEYQLEAMSVIGDVDLLQWAASGAVLLRPSTEIHAASWLAKHQRFTAVLGALQVDRHGNVGAHHIGGRDISGVGGAPDLAAGAHRSPGGLSIVALPSRSRAGTSNLVDSVEAITVAGNQIDAVATEHGAVVLTGTSPAERSHLLSSIFPST